MVSCTRDKMLFPGCRIVRVGTLKWKPRHTDILEDLVDKIRSFLDARSDMPFEQLRHEIQNSDVISRVGGDDVHLLYGPDPLFVSNGQLEFDIKGLVLKPRTRISKGGDLLVIM